ncbi:hypothetical protein FBEOM_8729 [Fusarium beomiforme]|uniref:Uncharacterized protein n=1 Tax=Fusarium beomiforme TaxID=44412 RepID=A0A9P5DX02_9HYPO|nr:hypothetical protein FBEOM_8729 [Fusarium beomiforme]
MSGDSHSSDEVTGPAAFWILASLALAAIAQPSASRKKDNLFAGNIDVIRSVPAVCVIDSIVDLFTLGGAASQLISSARSTSQTCRNSQKATGLVVRLALTIFTVLPQTIKVFSLKGVVATQICAFIFFFATVTKLLVSICGLEPEGVSDSEDKHDLAFLDTLLASLLQGPFEIWIWFNISREATFQLPTQLQNFCSWLLSVITLAMLLQVIIWIAYLMARWRFDLSGTVYMIPMKGLYLIMVVLGVAKQPPSKEASKATIKPPPRWMDTFNHTMGLMICTALVSIAIAKILETSGNLLALLWSSETSDNESAVQTTMDQDTTEEQNAPETPPPAGLSGTWLGKTGVVPDQWVVRGLTLNTTTSANMTLTLFNLVTTVFYYLVYFDGSGTANPSWTSVLGR